jgi:hypothetical protein
MKIPNLMKRFINLAAHNGISESDLTVAESDEGLIFANPLTQTLWVYFKMGHEDGARVRPAWNVVGVLTPEGLQLSDHPVGYTSHGYATEVCRKINAARNHSTVILSVAQPGYQYMASYYNGNHRAEYSGKHLRSVPLVVRPRDLDQRQV